MMSQQSAPSFWQENHCACADELPMVHLHICQHPHQLTIYTKSTNCCCFISEPIFVPVTYIYIYTFCMLCICLNVYHFVHNIILIILAYFYTFRLFFFQITENYIIYFTSAIYMFKITIRELFLTNIHFGFYFQYYYG